MGERDTRLPILLAEGDLQDEQHIYRAYEHTGYPNRMLCARTSEHAMVLMRACSNGIRFGLVLLDLHLPRVGAADFLQRLRRDPRIGSTPVFVLCPVGQEHLAAAASQLAQGWAKKPSDPEALRNLLNHILERFLCQSVPPIREDAVNVDFRDLNPEVPAAQRGRPSE